MDNIDSELKNLLKPQDIKKSVQDKRVEQTINNINQEQSINDFVTFSLGKIFSTLMVILAPLFAWANTKTHKKEHK